MMETPCQKIVWEVLPAIRAAIAIELVRHGFSQVEASRMLEIAPSAVSQYISGRRGYRIELGEEAKTSIELLAQDLKDGKPVDLAKRTCEICRQLRGGEDECTVLSDTRCGS